MAEHLPISKSVLIPIDSVELEGDLQIPAAASGVVLFAHGSGSSRHSSRNQFVARVIREHGIGTLLFDLLTRDEEAVDTYTRHLRFDIDLLSKRLVAAAAWLADQTGSEHLSIGFFGASTGGAAALGAAARLKGNVGAVVSRGGRPDLAGASLSEVISPVLLIVGGNDDVVIELNQQAFAKLSCAKELKIVPGATHLFQEPGALETVAQLAAEWFARHFATRQLTRAGTSQG
ncbi:MAG: alpha/beta family hydrolase [Pyrinomonadaceae bacterium]